jgi:4-deoxy-L-threo-5-hexosulose-uronate ketol-isomerase
MSHSLAHPHARPSADALALPAPGQARPGVLLRGRAPAPGFQPRFTPASGNLELLSGGEHVVPPGAASAPLVLPDEEALLFMWRGSATVEVEGQAFALAPLDALYVPRGAAIRIDNGSGTETARVVQLSAPARRAHPVRHARFAELSRREDRIRRLRGKDVYVLHGEEDGADRLLAGYTFFQPRQRSWPPHNHRDQEEVYVFLEGRGAMEVYESPETMTFVHEVGEGDMVTIPVMNYHPVFTQDAPLRFIWCIAGARYWIGDRSAAFMAGDGAAITT